MTVMTRLLGVVLRLPARDGRVTRMERDLPLPAADGTPLLTDHHAPPGRARSCRSWSSARRTAASPRARSRGCSRSAATTS